MSKKKKKLRKKAFNVGVINYTHNIRKKNKNFLFSFDLRVEISLSLSTKESKTQKKKKKKKIPPKKRATSFFSYCTSLEKVALKKKTFFCICR